MTFSKTFGKFIITVRFYLHASTSSCSTGVSLFAFFEFPLVLAAVWTNWRMRGRLVTTPDPVKKNKSYYNSGLIDT